MIVFKVIFFSLCLFKFISACDTGNCLNEHDVGKEITDNITFRLYLPKTLEEHKSYKYECSLSLLEHINPELKIIFFLHGFSEKPTQLLKTESIYYMANAFGKYENVNLIIVDYEKLVQANLQNYLSIIPVTFRFLHAYKNAKLIGQAMGYFFKEFFKQCNNNCENQTHIIGFSIGAQILHFSARILGEQKLKRVTAIESGGPIYSYPIIKAPHITRRDVEFLDGIHTDGGPFGLGYPNSFAHADFYPNRGIAPQPQCKNNTIFKTDFETYVKCNHYASVLYYAESIKNSKAFPSRKCQSYKRSCTNDIQYMGYEVSPGVRGNYYLTTNENSPYGKGLSS